LFYAVKEKYGGFRLLLVRNLLEKVEENCTMSLP
jgi:hypothetical protein